MKKLIVIAAAGCMVLSTSAMAAPAVQDTPAAAPAGQPAPAVGTRAKLVQRAASTARGKSNKFLGLAPLNGLLVGIGSLFAVAAGSVGAAESDSPGSS
jgi:hypothetical protein